MKLIRIIFISIITVLLSIIIVTFSYQAYYKFFLKNDLISYVNPNDILVYIKGDIYKFFNIPHLNDVDFFNENKNTFVSLLKYKNTKINKDSEIAIFKDDFRNIHFILMFPYKIDIYDKNIYFKYFKNNTLIAFNKKSLDFINEDRYFKPNIMNLKQQIFDFSKDDLKIYINYANIFNQLVYGLNLSNYNIKFYPGIIAPILNEMKNGIYSINFFDNKLHLKVYNDFNIIKTISEKFSISKYEPTWLNFMRSDDQWIIKSYQLNKFLDDIKNVKFFSDIINLNLQALDYSLKENYDLNLQDIADICKDDYMILQTSSGNIAFFVDKTDEKTNNLIIDKIKKSLLKKSVVLEKFILEDGKIVDALKTNADTIAIESYDYSGFLVTSFFMEGTNKDLPTLIYSGNLSIITSDIDTAYKIIDRYIEKDTDIIFKDFNITYRNYFYLNTEKFFDSNLWVFGEYSSVISQLSKIFKIIGYANVHSVSEVFGEGIFIYKN